MAMRRVAALGAILLYFLLAGSYHLWAQRQFNARMNGDIESFLLGSRTPKPTASVCRR